MFVIAQAQCSYQKECGCAGTHSKCNCADITLDCIHDIQDGDCRIWRATYRIAEASIQTELLHAETFTIFQEPAATDVPHAIGVSPCELMYSCMS